MNRKNPIQFSDEDFEKALSMFSKQPSNGKKNTKNSVFSEGMATAKMLLTLIGTKNANKIKVTVLLITCLILVGVYTIGCWLVQLTLYFLS